MDIRIVRILMIATIAMVAIDGLWTPVILGWAGMAPESFGAVITPVASQVDSATIAFKFLTMIVFASWIYAAGCNLLTFDDTALAYSPASRIWWFFVPFASLWKPYTGMRELWNASYGREDYSENNSLLILWWVMWLLHGGVAAIAGTVSGVESGTSNTGALWLPAIGDIGTAILAILIVRGITLAQEQLGQPVYVDIFA